MRRKRDSRLKLEYHMQDVRQDPERRITFERSTNLGASLTKIQQEFF